MPKSPRINARAAVQFSITSDGSQIDDTLNVVSVTVTNTLNKIPQATIVAMDGDSATQDFPVSNGNAFKPGAEVTIKAGFGGSENTIFQGIVVKHGIRIGGNTKSQLVIECSDKTVAMTIGRRNARFVDSKDSDIISGLISNYRGLSFDIDETTTRYKELIQYYCSDWDFLMSRAEVNSLLVSVEAGQISLKTPRVGGTPALKMTNGEDLIELHADIDAPSQLSEVVAASWDPEGQTVVEEQAVSQTLNAQGNLTADDLAEVAAPKSYRLQTAARLAATALKDWADGRQLKAGLARIRGSMTFQGKAVVRPGSLIELIGVGDRFSGNVFVSSVKHQLARGTWTTSVDFGMSPDWYAESRNLVAPPAAGLLPGVEGLQIGVVEQLDKDPDGLSRVRVTMPFLQTDNQGVWARLANLYASRDTGAFFIPEIGDEVILGHLNNDPSNPVVLGSAYSTKHPPPYDLTSENHTKAIVTKSKLKIELDDDKKETTIATPGSNKIVLSNAEKSIVMEDQNGNKVELSTNGIVIDSHSDIKITCKGKLDIETVEDIDVRSNADVSVSALNVEHKAKVGFVANGHASAELSASGQTTIKGAMVMIN